MGAEINGTDRALTNADHLNVAFSVKQACSECEGRCYSGWVQAEFDGWGREVSSRLTRRDHLELWEVLGALGRWLLAAGAREKDRDNHRWMLEHQPLLW